MQRTAKDQKQAITKLALRRETIRALADSELITLGGGKEPNCNSGDLFCVGVWRRCPPWRSAPDEVTAVAGPTISTSARREAARD